MSKKARAIAFACLFTMYACSRGGEKNNGTQVKGRENNAFIAGR